MSKKTRNNDQPIGKVTRVKDFLPPPSALVAKEENIRITISLSKDSVQFFKREAEALDVPYQKMIRSALDEYARFYSQSHSNLHP
jgi:predicted DNA binding CopG/RHH family protein